MDVTVMLVGGAVVNASYLWFGHRDYAAFADPAHFGWVTDTWRAVVAPHQAVFMNLLIAFEAVVGVLILSGGRRTQLGLVARRRTCLPGRRGRCERVAAGTAVCRC